MQIDTRVVIALLRLRSVDPETLGNLLHVPYNHLMDWLVNGEDSVVPFDTQLEAVKMLGIHNETPRRDRVHYWRVREPFLGNTHDIYQDLITIIGAFGEAEVVHIVRDNDPTLAFKAKSYFGIRFKGFYAMLEVFGHPLRDLRFDPDRIQGLSWVERAPCVALDALEYDRLEPGSLQVTNFQQRLTYQENRSTWDTLQDAAAKKGVDPAMLSRLVELAGSLPQLTNATDEEMQKALTQQAASQASQAGPTPAPSPTIVDISVKPVAKEDDDDGLLLRPVPSSGRH